MRYSVPCEEVHQQLYVLLQLCIHSAQMGNGASLVPERCQNSAEPLERNKRLAERN
jgi:hypothetical protein